MKSKFRAGDYARFDARPFGPAGLPVIISVIERGLVTTIDRSGGTWYVQPSILRRPFAVKVAYL